MLNFNFRFQGTISIKMDDMAAAAQTQGAEAAQPPAPRTWRRRTLHLAEVSASFGKPAPIMQASPSPQTPRVPRVPPFYLAPAIVAPPTPILHSLPIAKTAPLAEYQRPVRIDSFSWDAEGQLHLDDRSMRDYVEPPIGADLMYGIENLVLRDWQVSAE